MAESQQLDESYVLKFILALRSESEMSKTDRMALNRNNYDLYQLKYDFSHKMEGQSKEIIGKTRSAVEQIKSFFQQALADLGDWFRITARDGSPGDTMAIKPTEMQKLLNYFLVRADYFAHVGNSIQSGLLGSLAISKIHGCMVPKPKFVARKEGKGKSYKKHVVMIEDKSWELRFEDLRQENYYPDPTNNKLYRIWEGEVDLHVVKQYAEGDEAIYDKAAVAELSPWAGPEMQDGQKARETGQNTTSGGTVPKVWLTEFWGTIIDTASGAILAENVVVTIANRTTVIRKPTPNPLWHQKPPIVDAPLIEVSRSPWGIALMDSGTQLNHALIELYNLMLDAAMKAIHSVNQIRVDGLQDPTQVAGGVKPGTNLLITSAIPFPGKVMEPVVTGEIPPDVMNMYNIQTQETNTAMMTNDLRMGAQSSRAVKATEVAAAENSLTSVFQGMAKNYESKKIQPELELACWEVCQNWDLIDGEVFTSLFGEERGKELAQMEPQDVFVATVNGMKFEVFGISLTLRRQADFRKWTTLMQTIFASEPLTEAFISKFSIDKFLGEVMTSLDIDKSKIANDESAGPPQGGGSPADPLAQPGAAPGAMPQAMSQIPSGANTPQGGGLAGMMAGMQMNSPGANAIR